jgi:hypothetical protein
VFPDFHKYPSVSKTVRVEAIVEIFKNIKFNDVMKMKPELSPIFEQKGHRNPSGTVTCKMMQTRIHGSH